MKISALLLGSAAVASAGLNDDYFINSPQSIVPAYQSYSNIRNLDNSAGLFNTMISSPYGSKPTWLLPYMLMNKGDTGSRDKMLPLMMMNSGNINGMSSVADMDLNKMGTYYALMRGNYLQPTSKDSDDVQKFTMMEMLKRRMSGKPPSPYMMLPTLLYDDVQEGKKQESIRNMLLSALMFGDHFKTIEAQLPYIYHMPNTR